MKNKKYNVINKVNFNNKTSQQQRKAKKEEKCKTVK